MKNISRNVSKVVFCICLPVVLCGIGAKASTLPPDPNNAALLYYQAFLMYEEPNQPMRWMLADYQNGEIDSNEDITRHIGKNRHAIELAVKAAVISKCDWGHDYSQGINMLTPNLGPLYYIASLLRVEARLLAEQGDYTTALDRCMTLRRIALHACDRGLTSYLASRQIGGISNETIQRVLCFTPSDVEELDRLRTCLIQTEGQFPSLASCLTQEAQMWVDKMHKDKVQTLLDMFPEGSLAGVILEPMLERVRKGDDTFFEKSRDYYLNVSSMIVSTLESGLPYTQTCSKLDAISERWSREAQEKPEAILTELFLSMRTRVYQRIVGQKNHVNALNAAIGLYIIKARTGQLPDTLPADCPHDLFSGNPFAYVKTADGFILRCQGKEEPDKDDLREFQFKVRR